MKLITTINNLAQKPQTSMVRIIRYEQYATILIGACLVTVCVACGIEAQTPMTIILASTIISVYTSRRLTQVHHGVRAKPWSAHKAHKTHRAHKDHQRNSTTSTRQVRVASIQVVSHHHALMNQLWITGEINSQKFWIKTYYCPELKILHNGSSGSVTITQHGKYLQLSIATQNLPIYGKTYLAHPTNFNHQELHFHSYPPVQAATTVQLLIVALPFMFASVLIALWWFFLVGNLGSSTIIGIFTVPVTVWWQSICGNNPCCHGERG